MHRSVLLDHQELIETEMDEWEEKSTKKTPAMAATPKSAEETPAQAATENDND